MSMKQFIEKREGLFAKLTKLNETVKNEVRAFTEEEIATFDSLENEIKAIDSTIEALKRATTIEALEGQSNPAIENVSEKEVRAFDEFIRTSKRADDVNWTTGDNGAVIPSSIANKIISKAVEISPIYQLATKYNTGGTLIIPYYDETTQKIEMAYAEEFAELTASAGKFISIELKGFLSGALSKIPKSLIHNSDFDIVSYVINAMSKAVAVWIEKELLIGTEGKIIGLSDIKADMTTTTAVAGFVSSDELMDVQDLVVDVYQSNSIWIMNRKTRNAIRKLKDADGNYLLNRDISAKWGYTLLGKDVYTSDNMPELEAGKVAIYYGDFSGLAVKLSENISIQVLREKYATQHVVGVVGWLEMDAKIENAQKISALKSAE